MSFQIPKLKDRFCSRPWREFLTKQPCFCGCGRTPCDPAHEIIRKRAEGSDATCIPLYRPCHRLFDDHKLTIPNLAERRQELWRRFLKENGIELQGVVYVSQRVFEEALKIHGLTEPPFTRRKNRQPRAPYQKPY